MSLKIGVDIYSLGENMININTSFNLYMYNNDNPYLSLLKLIYNC